MKVWILFWLPQVGDEVVEAVYATEEAALRAMAGKSEPGHYSVAEFTVFD